MLIPRIEIKDASDYSDWASDVISDFTESILQDKRYCLPIAEQAEFDPEELDETWEYVFTIKGQRLVEHWTSRLYRIGELLFPKEEYFDISNLYYNEG